MTKASNGLSLAKVSVQRSGRDLLRDVDFEAAPGRLVCLLGPNGSGKSSLLRVLTGLWTPDRGEALLDGQPLEARSRRDIARRVAFVPQDARPSFPFTIEETVAMGRYSHLDRLQRWRGEEAEPFVREAMLKTDIDHLAGRKVTRLSGGEWQRVLLARCLASQAECIVLDEPTSNLDLAHALHVMHLCLELSQEGRSIVMALHDLNAALRFADEVSVLDRGQVVARGTPEEVLSPERVQSVFDVSVEALRSQSGEKVYVFDLPSGRRRPRSD